MTRSPHQAWRAAAVQRAPRHGSWHVERRGSAARRVAARRPSSLRRLARRAGVAEREQQQQSGSRRQQRGSAILASPELRVVLSNNDMKLTASESPPALALQAAAHARRTPQRGLAKPPRAAASHSNGGLELPVSVNCATALRAPTSPLPAPRACAGNAAGGRAGKKTHENARNKGIRNKKNGPVCSFDTPPAVGPWFRRHF